ncbi:MAG: hypothetical protein ACO1N5_16870 [Noviherbaspirillum sp.]
MPGKPADAPAAEIARAQAFDLLESYNDIPLQGAKLRAEPGAARDHVLDAGRLHEENALSSSGMARIRGRHVEILAQRSAEVETTGRKN